MKKLIIITGITALLYACSGRGENKSGSGGETASKTSDLFKEDNTHSALNEKGIGPITELTLGTLDHAMAAEGKTIYNSKCTACHNPTEKLIGPPQKGVLDRRTPEWVMNMMLNPQEMLDKDPIAQKLLKEYNNVPMTPQGLTEDDARKVLEYIRTL